MSKAIIEELESRRLLAAQVVGGLTPAGLGPTLFAALGKQTIFVGTSRATGRELFISDGTPAGTKLVVDLTKGVRGSRFSEMESSGLYAFFLATVNGKQGLWRTDGTATGTIFLHAFDDTGALADESTAELTTFHGKLFLKSSDELWSSDGTRAGTEVVYTANNDILKLIPAGNSLYFVTGTGSYGIWKSDGTTDGTRQMPLTYGAQVQASGAAGGAFFAQVNIFESGQFISHIYEAEGDQLVSIGSAGGMHNFIDFNGAGYFVEDVRDSKGNAIEAIIRHKGTQIKTVYTSSGFIGELEPVGDDTLLFPTTGHDLWSLNLQTGVAARLMDMVQPGEAPKSVAVKDFVPDGKHLLFTRATSHGSELWITDGRPDGTSELVELDGDHSVSPHQGVSIFLNQGIGYFSWLNETGAADLWVTDGTVQGTHLLAPPVVTELPSNPIAITPWGHGVLFFTQPANATGSSLYYTDLWLLKKHATPTLLGVWSTRALTAPAALGTIDGDLYLSIPDERLVNYIWKTDGTARGTVSVGSIAGASASVSQLITPLAAFHNQLIVSDSADRLLVIDGRNAGARLLQYDAETGPWLNPVAFGGKLYVRHEGAFDPYQLWSTKGRSRNTQKITDWTGEGGKALTQFGAMAAFDDKLYFCAAGSDDDWGLYSTNGITTSATLVSTLPDLGIGHKPSAMVVFRDKLYFLGNSNDGTLLFETDGTPGGTIVVKRLCPDQFSTADVQVIGDELYFRLATTSITTLIFQTDGTGKGTAPINPANVIITQMPALFGGSLFFSSAGTGQVYRLSHGAAKPITHLTFDHNTPPGPPIAATGGLYFAAGLDDREYYLYVYNV